MALDARYSEIRPYGDALGGITAAVVSLPLALTFGAVSGLGPEAGLYGAVIVGLVAAVFGGTRTLISEPTGPMTVMMTAIVAQRAVSESGGGVGVAFLIVMIAGLVQVLIGKLRLGRYISMMPYGVVSGFMSGIGVLLVVQQFPQMVGVSGLSELFASGRRADADAILGAGALLVLFIVPKKLRRYCPPQLLVMVLSVFLVIRFGDRFQIDTMGTIAVTLPSPTLSLPSLSILGPVLVDSILLGLLGSIDTLLTATIADNLTRTNHDADRELIGQGIANFASGLFGGLPGAGATMGTVVSIQSGARSPVTGIVRSVVLIGGVVLMGPVISQIPVVVLAAIAVKVGIDILDWSFIGRAHRVSRSTALIMYTVLALTVLVDLVVAVGVGVFVANILTIERLSKVSSAKVTAVSATGDPVRLTPVEQEIIDGADGTVQVLELSGPMMFGVANAITREISTITDRVQTLVIDLESVQYLDATIALLLENLVLTATARGACVSVAASHARTIARLDRLPAFRHAVHRFNTRLEALHAARLTRTPSS